MKNNLTEARFQFLAGVINENEVKQLKEKENNTPISGAKLLELISRDLQYAPVAEDMLSIEDALEIMDYVIKIEGSDITPNAALGEYAEELGFDPELIPKDF